MDKKLFNVICEFCEYLTDWDEKKQDYINNILPDLKYGYCPNEIVTEVRMKFYLIRDFYYNFDMRLIRTYIFLTLCNQI